MVYANVDQEPVYTKDTKRLLKNGDEAYYIEFACEWWDSWLRMIISCFKSGMTKEEIREALDHENGGWIYWTEYWY